MDEEVYYLHLELGEFEECAEVAKDVLRELSDHDCRISRQPYAYRLREVWQERLDEVTDS